MVVTLPVHETQLSQFQRLWMRLDPDRRVAMNWPICLRLQGPLDLSALREAVACLVARHEVLRAHLTSGTGGPMLAVRPEGPSLHVRAVDVRAADVGAHVRNCISAPRDFFADGFFRAELVGISDSEHLLVLLANHVIMDEWSAALVTRELSQLYHQLVSGSPIDLPPAPSFFDHVAAIRSQAMDADDEFAHAEVPSLIPRRRSRVVDPKAHVLTSDLPLDLAGLQTRAASMKVTPHALILAGTLLGLWSSSGRPDVIFTNYVSFGRVTARSMNIVGPLVTTSQMWVRVREDETLQTFVESVLRRSLAALRQASSAHEDLRGYESDPTSSPEGPVTLLLNMLFDADDGTLSNQAAGAEAVRFIRESPQDIAPEQRTGAAEGPPLGLLDEKFYLSAARSGASLRLSASYSDGVCDPRFATNLLDAATRGVRACLIGAGGTALSELEGFG